MGIAESISGIGYNVDGGHDIDTVRIVFHEQFCAGVHVLEDHVGFALMLAPLVNLNDAGVFSEGSDGFGLANEEFLVVNVYGIEQEFQRDAPVQHGVFGEINAPESTDTEDALHVEVANHGIDQGIGIILCIDHCAHFGVQLRVGLRHRVDFRGLNIGAGVNFGGIGSAGTGGLNIGDTPRICLLALI